MSLLKRVFFFLLSGEASPGDVLADAVGDCDHSRRGRGVWNFDEEEDYSEILIRSDKKTGRIRIQGTSRYSLSETILIPSIQNLPLRREYMVFLSETRLRNTKTRHEQ